MDPTLCAICNATNAQLCRSCHSVAYCSTECQQTDQPLHETICTKLSKLNRPSPSHKLAFLLPIDSKTPEPIWIKYTIETDDDDGLTWENADFISLLGLPKTTLELKLIKRNVLRSFELKHRVIVICRETFAVDGSATNACVVNITRGVRPYDWRGSILVVRQPTTVVPRFFEDATAGDLRIAVDYFTAYGNEAVLESSAHLSGKGQGNKIKGVKISCLGEQRVCGTDVYSAVEIPHDHIGFALGYSPRISEFLGLKLVIGKYLPDESWRYANEDVELNPFTNVSVASLCMNADPTDLSAWGRPERGWRDDVGSVVVVRQDCKPLTSNQVEALCRYCQAKLRLVFEEYRIARLTEMTRGEVVQDVLTEKAFREFFEEYKRERVRGGRNDWAMERFPCDV